MLQFCPVCGKILQLKNENEKTIGFCSCGFKRSSGIELTSTEKGKDSITEVGDGVMSEDKEEIQKLSYEDKKERKADF